MVGQRALYPGNGAGDRSQTWSKVSSKVVLLKYSAIAIFAKIAIWRVISDTVTYVVCKVCTWDCATITSAHMKGSM